MVFLNEIDDTIDPIIAFDKEWQCADITEIKDAGRL